MFRHYPRAERRELWRVIRKAFELYATGNFNVFELTDILHEKGLRTRRGNKLSHGRMFDILKNRFYIGELHWGKVNLKQGKHEAIISEELFNSVQRMLASKNRHACRRRKYSWLLNGFLRCYTHGCRYTAEWHLNKKIGYHGTVAEWQNRRFCHAEIRVILDKK
ncbi:MAG: hypothetical protein A2W52_00265 [Candidatus Taylorbacteria bacterium RIFCSPHIGHO2_02_49_25]|uniref:Recombinase domain-containing protein n=1 Tax=Candidatus Taylorbacteria bacterium RIFCSPHIGHO2_02_49_25 TaxID=1802305 RepID=A0A1G2MGT2_9BACT|nr:MAG: hypothetical protein A2759_03900 [Candidatus Taylorbacteria bacterium RIFCSPHIGHO2_01_FULL_49_60]OHA23033.1 MAG: hypothetical protein A2W52_00265 [Candidatus Taylorbacteria bacterium RIFCSPHIGHO2_02_49_25]OHA36370.1 MAG: hypothetical protein A2W65_02600 [Candidatus Taylorbacteria bacterium RIFCSPLOWO2_02_50_13]OHA46972.1 MAG: hypothetical protein A3G61_01565 [Candidatus Taylorbacteria bacterium RIFCSPLOWO2_12_FULL_49_67]